MNSPSRSIVVFGIYVLLVGLGFLLLPNVVLPIFGFAQTGEVWIRVIGILAIALSLYYFYAAHNNDLPYFRISVVGRVWFFLAMTALALLNLGGPMLIGFGLVDLLAAGWTFMALRAQGEWKL
jgi:hypothetical protein